MQCPKCHSRQVKSCEATYLTGSRWGHRQTVSELAQRCAPPSRHGMVALEAFVVFSAWWCFGVALCVAVWSLEYPDWSEAHAGSSYLDFLLDRVSMLSPIWYALLAWFAIAAWRYVGDRDGYARRYLEWERSWICMQCATVFSHEQTRSQGAHGS